MKAKHLFEAGPGEQPPGGPPRRPRTPPPRRDVPQDLDDPSAIGGDPVGRMVGRPGRPKGQFDEHELSQLKDVVIMMLAKLMGSDLDMQIGKALMSGQPLEKGQLQHILDEARQLDLPESHGQLMQKIFTTLQQ